MGDAKVVKNGTLVQRCYRRFKIGTETSRPLFFTRILRHWTGIRRRGPVAWDGRAAVTVATRDHGCQLAIAKFLDCRLWPFGLEGLWLRYAMLQNLIPSFPWISPGWRAGGASGNLGTNARDR